MAKAAKALEPSKCVYLFRNGKADGDGNRRRNRLALLQRLRHLFLDVADLSCLNMS